MIKKIVKFVTERMDSVKSVEEQKRTHSTEIIGKYKKDNVIINITIQTFPDVPKNKGGLRMTSKGTMKYDLTKEEEKFIKECYCNRHMDGRQIFKVAGIHQPSIYTFIRQKKLKPVYDKKITKTERNVSFDKVDDFLNMGQKKK